MSYRRKNISKQYATKHHLRIRALNYLRTKGPVRSFSELAERINIEGRQLRTFHRICKEEKDAGNIILEDGKGIYAYGHTPPEKVDLSIAHKNAMVTIPLSREKAKEVLRESPLIENKETAKMLKKADVL